MRLFLLLCGATFSSQSHAAPRECTSFAVFSSSGYSEKAGSRIEISNMPDVRDQGPLPICHAFSSAIVVQRAYCQSRSMSCANLGNKDKISPLSMLAEAHRNTNIGLDNSGGNHTNLRVTESGAAVEALANANDFNRKSTIYEYADSCYPYDQFIAKYSKNISKDGITLYDKDKVESIFDNLRRYYEKYNKQVAEGTYCADCAMQELATDFKEQLFISPSAKTLYKAFQLDDFAQFTHRVILSKCSDLIEIKSPRPKFESYPTLTERSLDKTTPNDYDSKMRVIKSVLKADLPLAIDGICGEYTNCKCTEKHSVVISGYKLMCKPSGICRDALKVQSSYGEEWQRKYDGGWIDARILLRDGKTLDNLDGTNDLGTMLSWYRY